MSRRPPQSADKAAQNQQTLKQLVKLEGNKSCADCKKNKHPRWASWNLGIFVCIRCSGIHRGMGTHISRVKSVDLDSWTDEQMQSMIRWGNNRANKYWEAKLAPGHVPADTKIENFIRTKYDSKRWVMEGPMPDPSTLGATDDDTPLNNVQEKVTLDRASSVRNGSSTIAPPGRSSNNIDLFGDEPSQPARPSTTEPVQASRLPPVRAPVAPTSAPLRQNKPNESLLGLDFFGSSSSTVPARPSSATSTAAGGLPQRSDLKQSILSLYASVPKAAPQPAPQATPAPVQTSSGLDDAFSSLNFGSSTQSATVKSPTFGAAPTPPTRQQPFTTPSVISGGSFFDPKPAQAPAPSFTSAAPAHVRQSSGFGDSFGDFTSAASTTTAPAATSSMSNLFDFSGPAEPAISSQPFAAKPAAPKAANPPPINMSSYTSNSAFNLSTPAPPIATPSSKAAPSFAAISNADPWASDNAWSTPEPEVPKPAPRQTTISTPAVKAPATMATSDDFGGWGSNDSTTNSKPIVTQDDDFGGWSSAAPVVATPISQQPPSISSPAAKPAPKAFGAGDDLFDNVWG